MGQEVWQDGPDLSMPLYEHLIELSNKNLIACRECSAIADISINGSNVNLVCPNCHKSLGRWETTPAASADLTAFIANGAKPTIDQ